jgi:hypothetical protein
MEAVAPLMTEVVHPAPAPARTGVWDDASRWVELFRELAAGDPEKLGQLSAKQREVVYLHDAAGMSHAEIGRCLGVPTFTAARPLPPRAQGAAQAAWEDDMTERHDPVTRLLSALEEPEPPRQLRERSLARAQTAWVRPPAVDPWSRLWHSLPLRLAWAMTVVVLAAANVALRVGPQARPRTVAPAATWREQADFKEPQTIVELPHVRPEYAGSDAPRGPATRPRGSNLTTQHHDMEDKS